MFERVRDLILYGGADKAGFEAVKPKMESANRTMVLFFASVAAVLIGIMFMLSASQEGFVETRPVYMAGAIFSLVLLLIAFLAKKAPVLSYVAVYMAISGFLMYGIAIGTITRPESQTVTFMVMMIFVPLLFVDKPVHVAVNLVVLDVLFIVMALHTKSGAVLSADIVDAVIFGILALVAETVVNRTKINGYVLEEKLHVMSETDQLTGLNNRNCYEGRLASYPSSRRESLCCIYIDANGLHELNNEQGHQAGDDMLRFIADSVKDRFGQHDSFRVGGDEFVAFAVDMPEDAVREKLDAICAATAASGYHIAVGYEFTSAPTVDVSGLIGAAEAKMYRAKAEYYREHDRRRR